MVYLCKLIINKCLSKQHENFVVQKKPKILKKYVNKNIGKIDDLVNMHTIYIKLFLKGLNLIDFIIMSQENFKQNKNSDIKADNDVSELI